MEIDKKVLVVVIAHIPHFKFIKILFHEFPTAMNLPNEVCYTNLHSYS